MLLLYVKRVLKDLRVVYDNALKARKITKGTIETLAISNYPVNFFDNIIDIFFYFKFREF